MLTMAWEDLPRCDYPFRYGTGKSEYDYGGDNGSGYSYEHETIEGFAFTQMSGIGWYGDLGNLLVMPTVGDLCARTREKRGRSRVSFPV